MKQRDQITTRYDTASCIYMRSKAADLSQLHLSHGTENKSRKIRKWNWKQKQICSEQKVRSRVRGVSSEGKIESMRWEGFVNRVGFKEGINSGRSDRYRKEWVGDRETGTRLSDGDRELIPETRWSIPYILLSVLRLSQTIRDDEVFQNEEKDGDRTMIRFTVFLRFQLQRNIDWSILTSYLR